MPCDGLTYSIAEFLGGSVNPPTRRDDPSSVLVIICHGFLVACEMKENDGSIQTKDRWLNPFWLGSSGILGALEFPIFCILVSSSALGFLRMPP